MGAGGDVDGGARRPSDGASGRARRPGADEGSGDASLVSITRQFAHYATVGIMFPVSIALGFFFGYLLDQRLGTGPLFALVGMGFGIAAAIRNLLRVVASEENG